MKNYTKFQKELAELINKHSIENGSDTPDYVLAEYLRNCLCTWETAIAQRERQAKKWSDTQKAEAAFEKEYGISYSVTPSIDKHGKPNIYYT